MRRLAVALAWLIPFWLPALAHGSPSNFLVVSIDGLAWSRVQQYLPRLPVLQKLLAGGASGPLQTVFPSMTWAAHASLATGRLPSGHGVLGNRYYDRAADDLVETWQKDSSFLRATPIWQTAKLAGWSTAALFWPNTGRSGGLDWQVPEVYGQRSFESGASPGLLGQLQNFAGLPPSHIGKLGSEEMFLLDSWIRDAAVWLIDAKRPRLLMVHFLSVDTLSHAFGPAAVEPRWGLELVDRYLGDLLAAYDRAGLRAKLAVCIVSDHGFLELTEAFSPAEALAQSPLKPAERQYIRFAVNGQAIFVYGKGGPYLPDAAPPKKHAPKPPPPAVALAKLRDYLQKQPQVEGIIEPEQFAELGLGDLSADPNLPDFIAVLRPDVQSIQGNKAAPRGKILAGGHGYHPTHPQLQGTFVLSGPGVAANRALAGMRAIDVAPTLAKLAGLAMPPPLDGTIKTEALAPP